jgi:DNA-binding FadR family transcriptional regulator
VANSAGKFGPYDQAALTRATAAAALGGAHGRLAVRVRTGAELVRARIALQVRLGLVAPGERLPDAGVVAENLGLSEITVRRALETMCQDGLLDRRRGRTGGTFVGQDWDAVAAAFHDPRQAAVLEDFHLLLECGLVARRAGQDPGEESAVLPALVREMDEEDDPAELLRLETLFHLELAGVLGEEVVRDQIADLLGRLTLLAPPLPVEALRARNACHAELLDALATGRLGAAVAAVKAHHAAR